MPAPEHGRLFIEGTVASGLDRWSMSIATEDISGHTLANMQLIVNEAASAFESEVWTDTDLKSNISHQTTYDRVRLTDISATGVTLRSVEAGPPSGIEGDGDDNQLPSECAEVISLRTDELGPRKRGRMYFPPLSTGAVHENGVINDFSVTALGRTMSDWMTTFMSGLHGLQLVVASDAGSALTPITSIRVGNVFDSQRGRRDRQVESYSIWTL